MNPDLLTYLPISKDALRKFDLGVKDKRELVSLVNESIYRKCAKTAKEKYEVLDLRDKLIKLVRNELRASASSTQPLDTAALTGACPDMCPEKERYARDYFSLCHTFETDKGRTNYYYMIKEYTRSCADQDLPLPNELRPLAILYETMLFIIDEVRLVLLAHFYSSLWFLDFY